jgi:hypothetical protein
LPAAHFILVPANRFRAVLSGKAGSGCFKKYCDQQKWRGENITKWANAKMLTNSLFKKK